MFLREKKKTLGGKITSGKSLLYRQEKTILKLRNCGLKVTFNARTSYIFIMFSLFKLDTQMQTLHHGPEPELRQLYLYFHARHLPAFCSELKHTPGLYVII